MLKLIIMNIDIHTCLLDSTFLCPHLFLINLYISTINKYLENERKTCHGPVHTIYILIMVFNLETFISILLKSMYCLL